MINFNTSEPNIRRAMGVTDEDMHQALDLLHKTSDNTIVWLIQRIWIDETFSDNAKCFLIFHIGVLWERYNKSKGKEDNKPWWK